jgi:glycosyltransferase involved in cell wall biosynthesis
MGPVIMSVCDTPRGEPVQLAPVDSSSAWIVVAAYNEARRIGVVLESLCARFRNVVVVNDGSKDATGAEVAKWPAWLVEHCINLGQGAALQTGLDFALAQGAEFVVTFDADGQHDPCDIDRLLEALRSSGANYALGSRFLGKATGIPWS